MMQNMLDMSELFKFCEEISVAPEELNKFTKRTLRKTGTALRKKTAQQARVTVNKTEISRKEYKRKKGTYHRSIKRGKLYKKNGDWAIRVYSNDRIAHLIENGYTPVLRNGKNGEKQEGKHVFEKTAEAFLPEWETETSKMIDEVLAKL